MKVLVVAPHPFYQERGTPIAIRLMVETLAEAGHEVDLLTYHEGEAIEIPGVTIERIPAVPWVNNVPIGFSWKKLVCDFVLSWKLLWLALRNNYHVIHAGEEAIFPALPVSYLSRSQLVYDMDSSLADQLLENYSGFRPVRGLLYACERTAMRRSKAVFAVCQDLAEKVRSCAPATKVYVIEDVALFSQETLPAVEDLRDSLGIRGKLALYVGNLERYQGIDLLLDSIAQLETTYAMDLVIIGGNGEDISKYQARSRELGIAKRVYFIGARPVRMLGGYLQQADILISPRLKGQNTPMKIYSYLAAGRAILATDIRSHTQVLDSSCSLLVTPEAGALAAGLRILIQDVELRRALGMASSKLAKERHSLEAYREKVTKAYTLLNSDKKARETRSEHAGQ